MKEKNDQPRILVVDDIPENISVLFDALDQKGFNISVANDGESAVKTAAYSKPDIILLDIIMPAIDGFETCRRLKANPNTRNIPVIFMTCLSDTIDKVKGFKNGAVDYITKPFEIEETISRIETHLKLRRAQKELSIVNKRLEKVNFELEARVEERTKELSKTLTELEALKNQLYQENLYLREEIKVNHNFEEIICKSEKYKKVLHKVEQVAITDATVLITGESGTGKELLTRAIHNISNRSDRPLVKVNCAALPSNLIESELFGHEKGAFTGAHNRRIGRFELANKGTIFLDEIGDLQLELQTKLLRILQEGEFEKLGSSQTIKVDVRVIAATNRNLAQAVNTKEFREDLFYRINVFPIHCPPLRERKEDIPILTQHFCKRYQDKFGKKIEVIPPKVMEALINYHWPGNVRELENVIERSMITTVGPALQLGDWLFSPDESIPGNESLALDKVEREHIIRVLKLTNWKIAGTDGAANILNINPKTLSSRMIKLGIKRPRLV